MIANAISKLRHYKNNIIEVYFLINLFSKIAWIVMYFLLHFLNIKIDIILVHCFVYLGFKSGKKYFDELFIEKVLVKGLELFNELSLD